MSSRPRRGFSLVVVVVVMILLSLVATGLLSLSAVTLRSVEQGQGREIARANALLALNLAVGELQRSVGPDQAITAMSDIRNDVLKTNLVGVWESWDYNPTTGLNYEQVKEQKFKRWLVSTLEQEDSRALDFASSPWLSDTVTMVSKGSLGEAATLRDMALAERIPITNNGSSSGAYAWHVADESVKARINQYRNPVAETLAEKRALLSGHRPDLNEVRGIDGSTADFLPSDSSVADFEEALEISGKLVSRRQFDLLTRQGDLKSFRNHLTPYSRGVIADARQGGLKKDLTSIFTDNASIPEELGGDNGRLYNSTHGLTGPSDPFWRGLADYHNTYQKIDNGQRSPAVPVEIGEAVEMTDLDPQKSFSVVPVISKIEMLFSFVNRDSHWWGPYMGHLVYAPLVTLHNPYNMSISFDRMKVSIGKVPVGVRLNINRRAQNLKLVPLNEMFVHSGPRDKEGKFILEIAQWRSPDASKPRGKIVLKPGQSLVCGPYIDPNSILATQIGGVPAGGTQFTNWGNQLVDKTLKARPGFYGRCVGFDLDWITPTHAPYDVAPTQQKDGQGVCLLEATDRMSIDFGFVDQVTNPQGEFVVESEVMSNGQWKQYGGFRFKFNDGEVLQNMVGRKAFRYPSKGTFNVIDAYVPNTEPLKDHARAKTFAVFSAYSRTTNGGVYESGSRQKLAGATNTLVNGRLAGKPFLHHNPAIPVVSVDLEARKPGSQSHEINLQGFFSNGDAEDYLVSDSAFRSPIIHGNSTLAGIKNGTLFELPSGPMQSIADFRRSNALNSSYLPAFTQPVANSVVSPLMRTNRVIETNSEVSAFPMLDHSVLANHSLYDGFYFSTVAPMDGRDSQQAFSSFLKEDSEHPLPSQSFQPHFPRGINLDEALTNYQGQKSEAFRWMAEYQMTSAPFNVNSTSVEAWKAVLSTLRNVEVPTLWGKDGSLETEPAGDVPILGMTLPNGTRVGDKVAFEKADDARTNEWNGFQELDSEAIETLASEIVEEVRLRGPFLSMSEFVNRQIGTSSELTYRGALESAIERSEINQNIFKDMVPIREEDVADKNVYPYSTPEVVVGNPAEGAPSWITQGDILKILEPGATVRSDTFVVRTMGEAWDNAGRTTSRVFLEAIVQRFPEYSDGSERPSASEKDGSLRKETNLRFGRRVEIVSLRWLKPEEV